jgi:hypothetical protein
MRFIRFEAELKYQLEHLKTEWRRSLREEPGTVLTLDAEVWGPPIGTTLSQSHPADFIAFLEKKRFPFQED